ncbi:MAG: FHA domain-containing protein [Alphaproteobacteria bacterium]|nr:FHA domain-containing protein [Alphaproteobacteria bacterium]MCB9699196.1 FHA domain-containing protein [Alphaproteobacteria bacterium]
MSGRGELWLMRGEEVLHVEPIGAAGVRLGRAPGNDLVLMDPAVSGFHAVVAWDADQLVVRDLGSRNGTTVDGEPVVGRRELPDGARLVLGDRVELRVRQQDLPILVRDAYEVELGDGAVRVPLRSDRVRLGGGRDADLVLPGAEDRAATLLIVGSEVRLATDEDDLLVLPDEPFVVAGHTLTLRRVDPALAATVPLRRTTYGYRLEAALDGPTGPTAVLTDPDSGRSHRVGAENRAVLLWLLGSRWLDDAARATPDRGWLTDDELLAGLWGREGAMSDPTRVRVLLCRLRRELQDAGLDGACLEKRQGHLRALLGEVVISGR